VATRTESFESRARDIAWALRTGRALAAACLLVACQEARPASIEGDGIAFPGLTGPATATVVPAKAPTPWTSYAAGGRTRLAVLLTDTASAWLGLAHGLKSIGIPFLITRDFRAALEHRVVLVYPTLSGSVLSPEALAALARHPRAGGTLIATNVLGGGLNELFGFSNVVPSRARVEVRLNPDLPLTARFEDPQERRLPLGNGPHRGSLGSYGYTAPAEPPLATYDDGTAAITRRELDSGGAAYAFGVDVGELLLIGQNNRDEFIARSYVNAYEPTLDVYLRLLQAMYAQGEPDAVTLGTVPQGREISVLVTHDIDYRYSLEHAVEYARAERAMGIPATYFIQTKYLRDWNDNAFFDQAAIEHLQILDSLGVQIASHTVSHSREFNHMPMGSGDEIYPTYQPRVTGETTVSGASVLGELRVSKFLLERFTGLPIDAFRPGHLRNPESLPEALEASGYRFSSSATANNSLTHLPFQLEYHHGPTAETPIFEFPVTIEDEAPPALASRLPAALELADHLRRYGGLMVLLIHSNVVEPKLGFERGFCTAVKDRAWFGTLDEFGRFWAARNAAGVDVARNGDQRVVTVTLPSAVDGLTLSTPARWRFIRVEPSGMVAARPGRVTLGPAVNRMRLVFDAGP
jgi:peptidoglycan/xylan/chitin deacetylase (PgdA/CDA1 family)